MIPKLQNIATRLAELENQLAHLSPGDRAIRNRSGHRVAEVRRTKVSALGSSIPQAMWSSAHSAQGPALFDTSAFDIYM
jgi:hypothetical protein